MKYPLKLVLLVASIMAALVLAACPPDVPPDLTGSLAFTVNLAPVVAAGLKADSLTATLVSGSSVEEATQAIAAAASTATVTVDGLTEGNWDATLTIMDGQTVLGTGTGQVRAVARSVTAITVTVTIPAPATDPAIGVSVQ